MAREHFGPIFLEKHDRRYDSMTFPGELSEHGPGFAAAGGLSENLLSKTDQGIGGDNERRRISFADGPSFGGGRPDGEIRGVLSPEGLFVDMTR